LFQGVVREIKEASRSHKRFCRREYLRLGGVDASALNPGL